MQPQSVTNPRPAVGDLRPTATARSRAQSLMIPLEAIWPNPAQPRRIFDADALRELAASIGQFGVLCPICVRQEGAGYELIAGERRLRAAKLSGLREIPCNVIEADDPTAEVLALVENIQRQDLHYMEEAEGIQRICDRYGLSREAIAHQMGKSQAAISNKLRLLRHPPEIRMLLRQYRLTERHARALLRLEELPQRVEALHHIGKKELPVSQSEAYIESLLAPMDPPKKRALNDPTLFFTTLQRALRTMRKAGVPADMERLEDTEEIRVTIRIPK